MDVHGGEAVNDERRQRFQLESMAEVEERERAEAQKLQDEAQEHEDDTEGGVEEKP
jgi:hypothetical protein